METEAEILGFAPPVGAFGHRDALHAGSILCGGAAADVRRAGDAGATSDRESPPGTGPWLPFLLTACSCVPTAVLAFAKQGGAVNNWSLITYFLLLASLSFARQCLNSGVGAFRSVAPVLVLATALTLALAAALSDVPKRVMGMRVPSSTARVFEYCRAHPGTAYFPWHPAAALAAEGKLNHFYYAVYDRFLAGKPITAEHFAACTPAAGTLMFFDTAGVFNERFFEEFVIAYEPCVAPVVPPSPIDGMSFKRKSPATDLPP
jgi:hypothetical protein